MSNLGDMNYPTPKQEYKVLVRCFTFNHSKYIEDALNGFAMQQTNFPFVCLVMDDASTDGEQTVIKKWMERECDMDRAETIDIPTSVVIIVPHKTNSSCSFAFYLLKQNLYGTGDKKMNHVYPWREKSEYEALCEGDDYWIDPLKLQKQVDFMESNPECTMSFHKVKIDARTFEDNRKCLYNKLEEREYSSLEIFSSWCVPTASVLMRKGIPIIRDSRFVVGDNPLFLSCAKAGKVYCMSTKVMAAYRLLSSGAVALGFEWRKQIEHFVSISEHFGNAELNEEIKKKMLSVYVNAFLNGKLRMESIKVLYKLCSSNIEIFPAFIWRVFCTISSKMVRESFLTLGK